MLAQSFLDFPYGKGLTRINRNFNLKRFLFEWLEQRLSCHGFPLDGAMTR